MINVEDLVDLNAIDRAAILSILPGDQLGKLRCQCDRKLAIRRGLGNAAPTASPEALKNQILKRTRELKECQEALAKAQQAGNANVAVAAKTQADKIVAQAVAEANAKAEAEYKRLRGQIDFYRNKIAEQRELVKTQHEKIQNAVSNQNAAVASAKQAAEQERIKAIEQAVAQATMLQTNSPQPPPGAAPVSSGIAPPLQLSPSATVTAPTQSGPVEAYASLEPAHAGYDDWWNQPPAYDFRPMPQMPSQASWGYGGQPLTQATWQPEYVYPFGFDAQDYYADYNLPWGSGGYAVDYFDSPSSGSGWGWDNFDWGGVTQFWGMGQPSLGSWLSKAFKKITGQNLSNVLPGVVSNIPVVGPIVAGVLGPGNQTISVPGYAGGSSAPVLASQVSPENAALATSTSGKFATAADQIKALQEQLKKRNTEVTSLRDQVASASAKPAVSPLVLAALAGGAIFLLTRRRAA